MKTILAFTFLSFLYCKSYSQTSNFTMEQRSGFLYNPALTGIQKYGKINAQYQLNAAALTSSNSNSFVSIDLPVKSIKSGFGFYSQLIHNNYFNLTNIGASYAFHGSINRSLKFSLGATIENKQSAEFVLNTNQALSSIWPADFEIDKSNHFNMNYGGIVYNEHFHLGFSANHSLISALPNFYNLNFGYKINLSNYNSFTKETPASIIPTVLLSYQDGYYFWKANANLNLKRFQFALGFQRNGISGYYGINIKDFSLNLAHTFIHSKLTNSAYMEHSISLQYNLIDRRIKSVRRDNNYYDFIMF